MRPEILFPLFAPVTSLKGVGPRVAPLVERAAGPVVRDVVFLAPQSLILRTVTTVSEARENEVQTFALRIDAHLPPHRSGYPYRIRAADETGFIFLAWFKGGGPHLARAHPVGALRAASGEVKRVGIELSIAHPDYLVPPARAAEIPEVEPVYPAVTG